uniref:Ubiquitinyl hydrolase 1 n=1 Tax=Bursaphelenchus xylophilus TaxID=6326 RepID=A0A1I7SSZ1_BURXY
MTDFDGKSDKIKSKWSCGLCTYNNIAGQLNCELCGTPRFGPKVAESAIQKQAELLSIKWTCSTCTFANIESADKCAKCENSRPSGSATSQQKSAPEITEVPIIENDDYLNTVHFNSEIASSSEIKWKCLRCTYLNFPNAMKCTMCSCSIPKSIRSSGVQKPLRISKDLIKSHTSPVVEALATKRNQFLVTGCLSRYINFYTGHALREDLFFRSIGALAKSPQVALDEIVNYLVNDGNVKRALNYFEHLVVLSFAPELHVLPGDDLLAIAKKAGHSEVVKMLTRALNETDNMPCAAAGPSSELFCRINHIFHFCRPPYNLPFRPYNFNIFRLPFPKNDFTKSLLQEMLENKFDPIMRQSLLRYVQIVPSKTQDVRLSTIMSCPSTLLMKNRGGNESFFDAILQSMFGVCDRYRALKTQLHDHIISYASRYETIYKMQCLEMSTKVGLSMTNDDIDEMWQHNMIINEERQVEAIHIFALSHLLQRPIIILPVSPIVNNSKRPANLLSMATSRSSAYHFLEGFYVPVFLETEVVSRSPLCLIHDNGMFYSWITNDDDSNATQNFVIVNYLRTQFHSLFRFVDESHEKRARSFLSLVQLTPCSVAVRLNSHECLEEATNFYYEYFMAAERSLQEQRSVKVVDVIHRMNLSNDCNLSITKMFSSSAKRMLSHRFPYNYDSGSSSEADSEDEEDETATKMAKVSNCPN